MMESSGEPPLVEGSNLAFQKAKPSVITCLHKYVIFPPEKSSSSVIMRKSQRNSEWKTFYKEVHVDLKDRNKNPCHEKNSFRATV